MPFYLEESDITSQVAGLRSVLIVPCGFCPAASLAVREKKPYVGLFRGFLKTKTYESFIQALRFRLEERGIETAVFDIRLPHHFVACMWTSGRRKELARRATDFEGVVVLGCDGAVQTVRDAIGPGGCRVIQGMDVKSLMNVVPIVSFPFNISLEMHSTTPVEIHRSSREAPAARSDDSRDSTRPPTKRPVPVKSACG